MVLHVILYEPENWVLTLRQKRRLRISENRILRRIYGPKWEAVKSS